MRDARPGCKNTTLSRATLLSFSCEGARWTGPTSLPRPTRSEPRTFLVLITVHLKFGSRHNPKHTVVKKIRCTRNRGSTTSERLLATALLQNTMPAKFFLYFAAFRIANVFLIQSQFDPDEYWQNLEPSYCRVFGEDEIFDEGPSCPGLTWEWKRRQEPTGSSDTNDYLPQSFIDVLTFGLEGPVRSFASIVPTLIFYAAIKRFRLDSSWMVSRGPLIVNAVLVAALTDWCVWYSSRWMRCTKKGTSDSDPKGESSHSIVFYCVYCSLSSWFNAYALVRTYSNCLETALLAVSFALVSPVSSHDRLCSALHDDHSVSISCKQKHPYTEGY